MIGYANGSSKKKRCVHAILGIDFAVHCLQGEVDTSVSLTAVLRSLFASHISVGTVSLLNIHVAR